MIHVNIVKMDTYQIMMVNVLNIEHQIVMMLNSLSKKDLQLITLNMYLHILELQKDVMIVLLVIKDYLLKLKNLYVHKVLH